MALIVNSYSISIFFRILSNTSCNKFLHPSCILTRANYNWNFDMIIVANDNDELYVKYRIVSEYNLISIHDKNIELSYQKLF